MLSSSQIRAARALLNISQTELAKLSQVSTRTIARIETDEEEAMNANQKTIRKLKKTLEEAGIAFETNETETTIRLKHDPKTEKNITK